MQDVSRKGRQTRKFNTPSRRHLLTRISEDTNHFIYFFVTGNINNSNIFREEALNHYFKIYDEYAELCSLAVHVWSGMPARGTEIAANLLRNVTHGRRTVFYAHKIIFIFSHYNKTNNPRHQNVLGLYS